MKVFQAAAALLVTVLICAGCNTPVNRAVWSPDGNKLAVLASDGLHLSDREGNLSKPLITNTDLVTWFPDSKRILVVTESKAENWKQVSEILGTAETGRVVLDAKKFAADLRAYSGDWDSFCKRDEVEHMKRPLEVITFLKEHELQLLKSRAAEKWKDLESVECTIYTAQIQDVTASDKMPGAVLLRSLRKICETRISPDGLFVALCETSGSEDVGPFRIVAVSAGGGNLREITNSGAKYPDWTSDGRSLVYESAVESEASDVKLGLGGVNQVAICDANKVMLPATPPAKNLAAVLFNGASRVRCLTDGRVLFSATTASLPCTAGDISNQQSLYELNPARTATVTRLVPRSAAQRIGDLVECFEVNPNGTMVSIPSHTGKVTVFTLSSGEVADAQPNEDKDWDKLILIPQWRSPDQLCFAAPAEKKESGWHRAEIVLWTPTGKSVEPLSQNWAPEAVNDFLREKDKQQSAK